MKHKTLFGLMLKAIGVWIGVTAIGNLANGAANVISNIYMSTGSTGMFPYYYTFWTGPLVQLGFACYLFFGGRWIVDRAIPSNRPYCHECGYDLTGAVGNVCNECGTAFRAAVLRETSSRETP